MNNINLNEIILKNKTLASEAKYCSTFIIIDKNGGSINYKKCFKFFQKRKLINQIIFYAPRTKFFQLKNVHFVARIINICKSN